MKSLGSGQNLGAVRLLYKVFINLRGYFRGGFIFANFTSQTHTKISTSIYMYVYL